MSGAACPAGAQDSPRHPDVLLLVADDLGWADVGYHGGEAETPSLDRLVREGVELERFYTAPVCSPARAGLFTGRDPARLGLCYSAIRPWETYGLPPGERTLGDVFQGAGYHTVYLGKWHLGHSHPRQHPRARGFDDFYGRLTGAAQFAGSARLGGVDWQRNGVTVKETGDSTDLLADEAVRVLQGRGDDARPLLLVVSFLAPHDPPQAPAELVRKYATRGARSPDHAASIEHLDQGIGRILAALRESGREQDTLVWFLSDNGAPLSSRWRNQPFTGGKGTLFEGGVHVPATLYWPGRLEGGRSAAQRVSYLDVLPTLAAAAGVSTAGGEPLDGADRWPGIHSGRSTPAADLVIAGEDDTAIGQAIYSGEWKFLQVFLEEQGGKKELLFQLAEDPHEQREVSARFPAVVTELREKLAAWQERLPAGAARFTSPVPHPGWIPPEDWAEYLRRGE